MKRFNRPGKPTQSGTAITARKMHCDRNRPHSSLGNITSRQFAIKMAMEK